MHSLFLSERQIPKVVTYNNDGQSYCACQRTQFAQAIPASLRICWESFVWVRHSERNYRTLFFHSIPFPKDLALLLPLWKSPIHHHPFFPLFLKIWICGVFFGSFYGHLSDWDCQTLLARHVVVLVFMEGVLLWRLYSSVHIKSPHLPASQF